MTISIQGAVVTGEDSESENGIILTGLLSNLSDINKLSQCC